ncbi:MAG TPA: HPr family phosphocarrier protein [Magnetospirillaceae bacterium]|nr:HPr family phosphocarrier protein [Magnetospirillaceae bacterium]
MTERILTIRNRAGIHARPAALIVQTAARFKAKIFLEKNSDRINAKSIMGIITLGAGYGVELRVLADGEDEADAVDAFAVLFDRKFEEE